MFHVEHKPLHNPHDPSQPLPIIPSRGRGENVGYLFTVQIHEI